MITSIFFTFSSFILFSSIFTELSRFFTSSEFIITKFEIIILTRFFFVSLRAEIGVSIWKFKRSFNFFLFLTVLRRTLNCEKAAFLKDFLLRLNASFITLEGGRSTTTSEALRTQGAVAKGYIHRASIKRTVKKPAGDRTCGVACVPLAQGYTFVHLEPLY